MITLLFKELAFTLLLNVTINHFTTNYNDSYDIEKDNFKGIENLNFEDQFLLEPPLLDKDLVEPELLDII